MTIAQYTSRNGELAEVAAALQSRRTMADDYVVPARSLALNDDGQLIISEQMPEGILPLERPHDLTTVASSQLAERCDIPLPYWRRMAEGHRDLLAANANYWLQRDGRSFLVRTLRHPDDTDQPGLARAVLSNTYKVMDDLDVLMAALDGIQQAGLNPDTVVIRVDLTERRMVARIEAPEIAVLAPQLLAAYRDPRTGNSGRDYPVMHAGLTVSNSEVGHGKFVIKPRPVVQVCRNGMTREADAIRNVHLGARLDEGLVRWSDEAYARTLELVRVKARDAVATFLDTAYLDRVVADLEVLAGHQLADPMGAIQYVGRQLAFTVDQERSILAAFIQGGDTSALGVAQAISYVALDQDLDGDTAHDLESVALRGAELAAAAPTRIGGAR